MGEMRTIGKVKTTEEVKTMEEVRTIGEVRTMKEVRTMGEVRIMEETLTFMTLSVNGDSVCLIKASIVMGAFMLVLMASIRASRSLIFSIGDLSWHL